MTDYANQLSDALRAAVREVHPPPPRHGTLTCPVCGEVMAVEDVFGLTTDVCPKHGVWLDAGELPAIIDKVKSRTRTATRIEVDDVYFRRTLSGVFISAFVYLFSPLPKTRANNDAHS